MSGPKLFVALLLFWALGGVVEAAVSRSPEDKRSGMAFAGAGVSSGLATLIALLTKEEKATR